MTASGFDDEPTSPDCRKRGSEGGFSVEEVTYLRDKAADLRLLARSAARPEILDAGGTVVLLERLAREFEQRAFEVEQVLRRGCSGRT